MAYIKSLVAFSNRLLHKQVSFLCLTLILGVFLITVNFKVMMIHEKSASNFNLCYIKFSPIMLFTSRGTFFCPNS